MSTLVLGGAGFIGGHIAARCLQRGEAVTIFDNFSRKGTRENADWLKNTFSNARIVEGDIALHQDKLDKCVAGADTIYHMAGQVAVTTSVSDPRTDFNANALGTFNVLEAMRLHNPDARLIYASTNKVYGKMDDLGVLEGDARYAYADLPEGVDESRPLDFYSPYGCSKGAGDQYVRDYARIFGLSTVVFRQSCIYGTRQFGIEDQGWLAWFTIAALFDKPISIYGDGKQVRDVLYIDDLLDAYDAAIANIETAKGHVYNVGGGAASTVSLLELIELLEKHLDKKVRYSFSDWRPGDQRIFVCDTAKARHALNWRPAVTVEDGVARLSLWAQQNRETIRRLGLA